MRNHLVQILTDEAKKRDDIVLLTGDLGYHVLDSFQSQFPTRFINAGIAEENMTSVAAGLALEGMCAVTYSIGNFVSLRCMEQIRNDVCYHNANVKIVSLAAGFAYGSLGMTHHATEDIACIRSLPNLTLFSPCDPLETMAVTKAALSINTPCFIRLGRGGEPNLRPSFDIENFCIGKAYKLFDGKGVVIFSTGAITKEAKQAVEEIKQLGFDIALYTFPTIKPIDVEMVIKCAKSFKTIITVEEHQISGGFGGAVAEILSGIEGEHAVLKRIGLPDAYTAVVGDTEYLRKYYGLDSNAIISVIKEGLSI